MTNILVSSKTRGIRTDKRPRLGFAGVGWIGRNRLEAIAKSGYADIVAIADLNEGLCNECKHFGKRASVHQSFDELLEQDIDGIVIATPSAYHAEQSISALSRGIAVFCQKPLGRNAIETKKAIECAAAADRLLGVDLSYRHLKATRAINEAIQNGSLGKVYAVDLVFHNAFGPDKSWFYDVNLAGGGCLLDLGIHLVDLGLWLLNSPGIENATGRLFHKGHRLLDRMNVEDFAEARIDLSNDTTLRISCSWNLSAGQDAVIAAQFFGTSGSVALRNVNGSFYDFIAEQCTGTNRTVLIEPPDDWGGRAAVAWARQLAESKKYDAHIEQLITVAEALDAVYASGFAY